MTVFVRLLILLAAGLTLGSCKALNTLGREVRSMNRDTTIIGRVAGAQGAGASRVKVFVLKRGGEKSGFTVADVGSPNEMGDFVFMMPDRSSYFVTAMADKWAGNGVIKEAPMGSAGGNKPIILDLGRGQDRGNAITRDLQDALRSGKEGRGSGAIPIACGDIASLEDAAFAPEAGALGMWEPVSAAKRNGLGVYFLEAYDPEKIPVIFVHGIGGTPRSSEQLMRALDRSRYQVWFYSYPSGIRLESAAQGLAGLTDRLHQRYRFKRMHVIAHSMGGLVARRAVQMMVGEGNKTPYVASLTTLSTPWNGMPFAAIGAIGLPYPMPCWLDMRPGSKFIRQVLQDPMRVPHLLVSTEKSRFKITLPRRNDGTVSVASQLDPRAVSKASHRLAIPGDHMYVLEAEQTKRVMLKFIRESE